MEGEKRDCIVCVVNLTFKDEVALELNKAVLYSYKKAGVSIVDHFTQVTQPIRGQILTMC